MQGTVEKRRRAKSWNDCYTVTAYGYMLCAMKAKDGSSKYVPVLADFLSHPICSALFCCILPHAVLLHYRYLLCSLLHLFSIILALHIYSHFSLICSAQLEHLMIMMMLLMLLIPSITSVFTFLHIPQAPTPIWALDKNFSDIAIKIRAEKAVE